MVNKHNTGGTHSNRDGLCGIVVVSECIRPNEKNENGLGEEMM